jgi:UDP-N-acetylglucosamine 2-epimerase (non-hydrolysing)
LSRRVLSVVGARPNFMKIAPVVAALRGVPGVEQLLVHTGQHYDPNLSQVFFDELGLPAPDVYLGVGSGSHAEQTARVMIAFEGVCAERRPDLVVVGGDVNSTLAATLVAAKATIPVAHVEAGLRSFDRGMPEEVNRVVVDHLSDLLFTTERSGDDHLRREGIAADRIHFVGNCMVDSLLAHVQRAVAAAPWEAHGLAAGGYALVTLHRPSNVDDPATLARLVDTLGRTAERLPVLFPSHPRTTARLAAEGIAAPPGVRLVEPLPYLAFLGLLARARCVLTDSGGIQEETTALDVPCLTLRANTERPVTVEQGSNRLVGDDPEAILGALDEVMRGGWPRARRPPLWDGRAGERIAAAIGGWFDARDGGG